MFARLGLAACVVAFVLITPGVATAGGSALYQSAKSGPAKGGSAVDQYTEWCATASGRKPCRSLKKARVILSAKAAKALGAADAATSKRLRRVARSASSSGEQNGQVAHGTIPKDQGGSSVRALGATVVSSGSGGTARLLVLLAAVIATGAVIGVIALRRQRS